MAQVPSEQPEPSQIDDTQSKGGDPSLLAWILGFLLIAYPLSIGPAAKLHQACPPARTAIEVVYMPVVSLARLHPKTRAALDWYVWVIWHVR